ncbi:MAG: hypothetical protein OXN17_13035 [Candidatus Poribacteria bacterium]|nr:hypothetical protein [Candidatus Poribacteria bacterium]MDE0502828.1 hypothetical protein [Candidatus Poribacteria bacterium]
MRRYLSLMSGVTAYALFVIPTVVQACPSCKLDDDPIAQGFKWSILFLMAMPYIVFSLVGGGIFFSIKRVKQRYNQ